MSKFVNTDEIDIELWLARHIYKLLRLYAEDRNLDFIYRDNFLHPKIEFDINDHVRTSNITPDIRLLGTVIQIINKNPLEKGDVKFESVLKNILLGVKYRRPVKLLERLIKEIEALVGDARYPAKEVMLLKEYAELWKVSLLPIQLFDTKDHNDY